MGPMQGNVAAETNEFDPDRRDSVSLHRGNAEASSGSTGSSAGGTANSTGKYHDKDVWDLNNSIKKTVEDRNALAADLIARAKAAAEDQVTSPRYADLMLKAAEKVGHASELLAELPGIHRTDNERDYRHEDARTGERNADISAATDL